jgi:two-component system, sensor histidine kinase YesM
MRRVNLRHWFYNMSLQKRLLSYFVLFFIFPIIFVGMVSYVLSYKAIKERAMQYSAQTIDRSSYQIDHLLIEANKISDMIENNITIQEKLRQSLEGDISKKYSIDLEVDTELYYMQSYISDYFGLYVIGENGGKYKSNYCSTRHEDLRKTEWYKKIVNSTGPVWFSIHRDSFVVGTIGQPFISLGNKIIDKATGRVLGVVVIDIEQKILQDKIRNMKLSETGDIFILDNSNNPIIDSNMSIAKDYFEKAFSSEYDKNGFVTESIKSEKGERFIAIYKTSTLTGWKIGGIVPINELISDSNRLGMLTLLLLLIVCIFTIIAAIKTSDSIAKPVRSLIDLMNKVEEGDLSVSMNVKYEDEIGKLGKSFNKMIVKIGDLMDRVYKEQKQLRKAELKVLQEQINPHFLYNTLDSIIWLSRANKNKEVITMATALTKLFRVGLSRGRDVVNIEEEIAHAGSYLTIQHIRYKNKFTYDIQVPEDLLRYKTLKLILQPIVENAIYHGIKEQKGVGHISVIVRDLGTSIAFEVKDFGKGMTSERLTALKNTLENRDGEKIDIYGIKNVNERIKIFFNMDQGITINSEYEIGTSVEIRIPKILEVDEIVKSNIS